MGWKIVSRPDCKWCARAKAHLAVRGVEFDEQIMVTRQEQLNFKDWSGEDTFPQIWDGTQHIGGFDQLKRYLP